MKGIILAVLFVASTITLNAQNNNLKSQEQKWTLGFGYSGSLKENYDFNNFLISLENNLSESFSLAFTTGLFTENYSNNNIEHSSYNNDGKIFTQTTNYNNSFTSIPLFITGKYYPIKGFISPYMFFSGGMLYHFGNNIDRTYTTTTKSLEGQILDTKSETITRPNNGGLRSYFSLGIGTEIKLNSDFNLDLNLKYRGTDGFSVGGGIKLGL